MIKGVEKMALYDERQDLSTRGELMELSPGSSQLC